MSCLQNIVVMKRNHDDSGRTRCLDLMNMLPPSDTCSVDDPLPNGGVKQGNFFYLKPVLKV